MRRPLFAAFMFYAILGIGFLVSGCGKQHTVHEGADFVGVYNLISIDGKNVPASMPGHGVKLEVVSGKFTIKADGTCTSKTVFVGPDGKEVAREVKAKYTKDGQKLTMKWQGAGTTVGTIQGETFTMDNEGMVFVYRK